MILGFPNVFSRDNIDLYESNDNIDHQLIIDLGIATHLIKI